ncbi:MAG: helix-turn-helix domain-containing protein, partial [Verrucomicrobiota bacterium]
MTNEMRQEIALQRYKLISPVLAETARSRNAWFRQVASREQVIGGRAKTVAVSTLKAWLKAYRTSGFGGLMPKRRTDSGRPRKLGDREMAAIRGRCKAFPNKSVQKLYEELLANDQLGEKP